MKAQADKMGAKTTKKENERRQDIQVNMTSYLAGYTGNYDVICLRE